MKEKQMKHTEEEIIDALEVLRDTCEQVDCDDCPLRSKEDEDDRCYLRIHNPSCYDIVEIANQPRRLFND